MVGGAGAILASVVCAPTSCTNSQPLITGSGVGAIVVGGVLLLGGTILVTQNTSSVVVQNPEIELGAQSPVTSPWFYVPVVNLTF